jgi:hypothetical protein
MRKGNTVFLMAFIALLIAVTAIGCRSGVPSSNSPDDFPIDMLARYENCSIMHIGEAWVVASYSERSKDLPLRSEFLAYRFDNGAWKRSFGESFKDAYNARIELRGDMEFKNNAIIVFHGNYGAAYEILHVYAIEDDSIRHLQKLESGTFAWVHQDSGGGNLLVAVPSHVDEKKIFYRWTGDHFAEVAR